MASRPSSTNGFDPRDGHPSAVARVALVPRTAGSAAAANDNRRPDAGRVSPIIGRAAVLALLISGAIYLYFG